MSSIKFTSDRASGILLIAGGVAFGLFWGSTLIDLQPPWMISLGVHGLSIVLISFGLINTQRARVHSPFERNLGWTGVALTVAGLVTLAPLFATGFAVVGLSFVASRKRLQGMALTLGSVAFFAAYVFGTHIGDEKASQPGSGLTVVFALALALIVTGLVAIGFLGAVSHGGTARSRTLEA